LAKKLNKPDITSNTSRPFVNSGSSNEKKERTLQPALSIYSVVQVLADT